MSTTIQQTPNETQEAPRGSEIFPESLENIDDCPQSLYYRGNIGLLKQPIISVIGSRRLSNYGVMCIEKIVPKLASYGVTIASGLALGCDAKAQQTALGSGGPVIAVLPGSVDVVYPRTNARLAQQILDSGGLIISDNNSTRIHKGSFLSRNRIVSGISSGVLVIEAGLRSGTMSTVNHALRQGREVMAVPGDISRPTSLGCNYFIKSGAALITSAEDVLALMNWGASNKETARPKGDNPHENAVIKAIGSAGASAEAICSQADLDMAEIGATLTVLEIKGIVFQTPDGSWYLR